MSVSQSLQSAFLLHSRPFRDSSSLLELYTRDYGRLGLVARGSQRPKSAYRGILQPFRELLITWGGRGELGTLHQAEAGEGWYPLNGKALWSGYYLNELLMRLSPRGDASPELFCAYRHALEALSGACLETALRTFEKQLLLCIGYAPLLDREARTGTPVSPLRQYRYQHGEGPVPRSAPATAASPPAGYRNPDSDHSQPPTGFYR